MSGFIVRNNEIFVRIIITVLIFNSMNMNIFIKIQSISFLTKRNILENKQNPYCNKDIL